MFIDVSVQKCLWTFANCPLTGAKATVSVLTWVFAPATPLDEAHDEEDQYDEGNGTHQADEPALSGYVYLVYVGWRHTQNTHTGWGQRQERRVETMSVIWTMMSQS